MKALKIAFGVLTVLALSPIYLAIFVWWFIAERTFAKRTGRPSNPCGHLG